MSEPYVLGYSGNKNIATNGSFQVDRVNIYIPTDPNREMKIGKYIKACWYVQELTVDYCACTSVTAGIKLTGFGSAGQKIVLYNDDVSPLGFGSGMISHGGSGNESDLTAGIVGRIVSGKVKMSCRPRRHWQFIDLYDKYVYMVPGRGFGYQGEYFQAVSIVSTRTESIDLKPYVELELQYDGEFEIYLYNFREIVGAFMQPSFNMLVSKSEEITRCEKFYQTGRYAGLVTLMKSSHQETAFAAIYVPLKTTMNGTPSFGCLSINLVVLYQDAASGGGSTLADQSNWGCDNTGYAYPDSFMIYFFRGSFPANRSSAYINFDWFAILI